MLFFFLAVYVTVRFHVEMGIKKLLPKLTNASKRVTFEEMRGSVIAVDASMLLHRGAYGCAAGRSLWKCHRQVRLNSIIDSVKLSCTTFYMKQLLWKSISLTDLICSLTPENCFQSCVL